MAAIMDETWEKWLFDLEDDECHLFNGYDKNYFEEEFINGENALQSELSWRSTHSSDSDVTTGNNYVLTAVAAATNNNNMDNSTLEGNTVFGYNTTSLKEHASLEKPMLSSPMSYTLSFEDFAAVPKEAQKEVDVNRKSKRGRSSSQIRDHIIAERKRRENLTKMFIALSAIIPGLKKMDKASIINNAIDYVKYLEKRVKDLEEQCKKRNIESLVCFKKDKSNGTVVDDSSCISGSLHRPTKTFPNVEASVSANDVLIRVMCEKRKNIVTKLLTKLETHDLSIVCSNVLPFGNSNLNITIIAQVDPGFSMRMDALVKNLNEDLLECL